MLIAFLPHPATWQDFADEIEETGKESKILCL